MQIISQKIPLIVILGPTATGKSNLAVKIAEWIRDEKIGEYNGAEIISADSRQVYKGLDIGTGKITPEEMRDITHHCLDIVNPQIRYTVSDWKKCADKAIEDVSSRGKLPILCGGTGFYIKALIENLEFREIDIDEDLQRKLEAKSVQELFEELKSLDRKRAETINNGSDNKNKRRLIRSIMIAKKIGHVPSLHDITATPKYDVLTIGISVPDEELKRRINDRLRQRMDNGMIEEVRSLHKNGLSYERMNELGLEYRYVGEFLKGKLDARQLYETLSTKIWQYARRQKTWFKREKNIRWVKYGETEKTKYLLKDWILTLSK